VASSLKFMPRCSLLNIVCLFHSKYERWEWAETESLPVNSDPIISLVVDINIHRISFVNPDYWPWETVIYNQYALRVTQLREVFLLQLQKKKRTYIMMVIYYNMYNIHRH
jgi:hypothetical protein